MTQVRRPFAFRNDEGSKYRTHCNWRLWILIKRNCQVFASIIHVDSALRGDLNFFIVSTRIKMKSQCVNELSNSSSECKRWWKRVRVDVRMVFSLHIWILYWKNCFIRSTMKKTCFFHSNSKNKILSFRSHFIKNVRQFEIHSCFLKRWIENWRNIICYKFVAQLRSEFESMKV